MNENQNLQVMTATSAALRFYDRAEPMALVKYMGDNIAGCFGWGTGQANAVALICITEGISPMDFYRLYDLMPGGKPRKRAQAVHAEFLRLGGEIEWKELGENGTASAKFTLGKASINYGYSLEKAKAAGLLKPGSAWQNHPEDMLRKTLVQKAIGILAPGIQWGEESGDAIPSGPALQLGKTADVVTVDAPAKAAPAPAKPAQPIIEVLPPPAAPEAVAEERELAAAGLAPEQPAEAPAVPLLDPETWAALKTAVVGDRSLEDGNTRLKALAEKMIAQNALPNGRLRSLPVNRALKIIDDPVKTLNALNV